MGDSKSNSHNVAIKAALSFAVRSWLRNPLVLLGLTVALSLILLGSLLPDHQGPLSWLAFSASYIWFLFVEVVIVQVFLAIHDDKKITLANLFANGSGWITKQMFLFCCWHMAGFLGLLFYTLAAGLTVGVFLRPLWDASVPAFKAAARIIGPIIFFVLAANPILNWMLAPFDTVEKDMDPLTASMQERRLVPSSWVKLTVLAIVTWCLPINLGVLIINFNQFGPSFDVSAWTPEFVTHIPLATRWLSGFVVLVTLLFLSLVWADVYRQLNPKDESIKV